MSRYLKVILHEFNNDSRDKRELTTARNLGFETVIISGGDTDRKLSYWNNIPIYTCNPYLCMSNIRVITFLLYRYFKKIGWITRIRSMRADLISCHDIDALSLGYLSTLFISKEKKPKLIYDAHEFEIGRNESRNWFWTLYYTLLERFLIKRCVLSIVVNDSIADEMQKIHKLKNRPLVIRSTPPKWNIDKSIIEQNRNWILSQKQWNKDSFL
ncbi:MAG: glycosyltransferase family 4 protein, partial [Oscillospiraceae bacterium]